MIDPTQLGAAEIGPAPSAAESGPRGALSDARIIYGDHIDPAQDHTPVVLPRSLYRTIDVRYWLAAIVLGALAWFILLRLI